MPRLSASPRQRTKTSATTCRLAGASSSSKEPTMKTIFFALLTAASLNAVAQATTPEKSDCDVTSVQTAVQTKCVINKMPRSFHDRALSEAKAAAEAVTTNKV